MRNLSFAALLVFAFGVACAAPPAADLHKRKDEKYLSIIQLIADPEKYDGNYVSIGGYLVLSREYENSLHLDENSYRSGMPNSIAIDFKSSTPSIQNRAEELDRHYIIVAGHFKAGVTAFSLGELQEVYYIAPASTAD